MSPRDGWLAKSLILLGLTIIFLVLGAVLLPPSDSDTVPRSGGAAAASSER